MMISVDNLTKIYTDPGGQEHTAVDHLSIQIDQGETLCLIGSSGSGKTTTLKMINRLIEPTEGTIRIDGMNISAVDPVALRRKLGYVIQRGGLFPHMNVAKNIGLLCELEGWPPRERLTRVHTLLELVNLDPAVYMSRFPGELSGGERQRVGVARALSLDPPVILMDEPFAALDPLTRDQIHSEFQQLRQEMTKTIILVTHDMSEAFKLGDRIALMDRGMLIQIGTEHSFRTSPTNQFVRNFLRAHLHG